MRTPLLCALTALALGCGLALVAAVASPTCAEAQSDGAACRTVRPGFVQCAETEIVGRRPSAYVLLGRARDRYEPLPLVRRDGRRELVRVVRDRPF